MSRILSFPGQPSARNVAQGIHAEAALRGWAARRMMREHLRNGEIAEASASLILADSIAIKAPPAIRTSMLRDLDRLAGELGRAAMVHGLPGQLPPREPDQGGAA